MNSATASEEHHPPPPIRSNRLRIAGLISASFLVAVMLLLVVLNLDKTRTPATPVAGGPIIKPLIEPGQLTRQDMTTGGADIERDPATIAAQRGQIQTMEDGRLRQYQFEALDPMPAGMTQLKKPRIEAHLSDDRVMTLAGDSALVHMPANAPDSGTMTGHVIIRLYTLLPGQQFDSAVMTPSMEVHTDEATFNNFQGEVTCAGWVDIQTATAHLPGSGLRMQINEIEHRPQLFTMAQPGKIRLSGVSKRTPVATSQPEAPASAPQSDPNRPRKPRPARSDSTPSAATKPNRDRSSRPAPVAQAPAAAKAAAPFYYLTLLDNVHIQQGDGTTGWNADGDELHIIFSMQSKGLSDSLAAGHPVQFDQSPPAAPPSSPPPTTLLANLAALTLATFQANDEFTGLYQPTDDEVIITCTGGLTMVPLLNAAEKPDSPDDAQFELIGRPVRLHNNEQSTTAMCSSLIYRTLSQKLRMEGSSENPLTIDSPELYASGLRLLFDRLANVGAFEGPGSMTAKEHPPAPTTQPAASDQLASDLRIHWQQGVDMDFEKPAENPPPSDSQGATSNRLHQATFNGDVQVTSADLSMRSDKMVVGFPPPPPSPHPSEASAATAPDQSQQHGIESILASGSVRAISLSNKGSLDCDALDVRFARDADGKSVPVKLTATNNVQAIDEQNQNILSNMLVVNFKPPESPEPPDSPELVTAPTAESSAATSQSAPQSGGLRRRAVQVDTLSASDNVQVIMADGARAFADQLEGDSSTQIVKLLGEDVMVVSDRAVIHHGKMLELRKAESKAYWPGPGEFLYYTAAIVQNTHERIARPQLDQIDDSINPIQMRAQWTDSMTYDSAFNDGAGSILLTGAVDAASTPSALERDTMNGQSLALEFYQTPVAATAPVTTMAATSPATEPANNSNPIGGGRRQLSRFIAQGEARLEGRTWLDPAHADKPRVFFIEGPIVTYDALTLEGFVDGAGQLLVRDEQVAAAAASQPQARVQASTPFSGKGTTSFRWTDHLQMTRRPDGLYNIDMVGGLQMLHSALDQSISTVVSDHLQAVVARSAALKSSPPAGTGGAGTGNSLDLGGSMDLKRLLADGAVYIHTPTRDIDCETFDYDYTNGLAILTAQSQRTVAITTKGSPDPLHAQRVVWDLNQDKITATNFSGAAPK